MTITINTDASYHPVHKVGAFAFWIVCTEGRVVYSGPLKSVISAQDAELQCIGNALHTLEKSSFKNIEHIYINTDCLYGIHAITKMKRLNGCLPTVKKIQAIISKLIIKYNYSKKAARKKKYKTFISWRHVPAHTKGENKRQWVNNKMDEMAKAALWQQINSKHH